MIGKVISDRYRVDSLLGEGAMGRVYLGEHVLMRKRVAIKFMHKELTAVPEIVQRFEREALAAAHIDHPHVASCTDFGRLDDGTVFLILEFVEGRPLTELIARGPLPIGRVMDIALQIAAALEAAHGRGIVHRDLKPDNILLVEREAQGDFAKVLDFGIAKVPQGTGASSGPITQVGMVYGTPEYMAPEQALGQEVDARADLYALGVIIYELLTGKRPYEGAAATLLGQQLSQPIPLMADRAPIVVPPGIEAFVRQLLALDVNQRVPSAGEAVAKLELLTEALSIKSQGGDAARRKMLSSHLEDVSALVEPKKVALRKKPSAKSPRRTHGALIAILFAGLGVAAGIFGLRYFEQQQAARQATRQAEEATQTEEEVAAAEAQDLARDIEVARQKGVEALSFLAEKYPAEAQIHATLAVELARNHRHEEAVQAARTALELDPKLNESPSVRGALFRAAQSSKAGAAAFRLLGGAMGSAGADIIYDLSQVPGVRPSVRSQAYTALASAEIERLASPQLRLLLAFSRTKHCAEVLELVQRAAVDGDRRVLPLLRKLGSTSGCGDGEADDCYPCLRTSNALNQAISSIERRVSLEQAETESIGGPESADDKSVIP